MDVISMDQEVFYTLVKKLTDEIRTQEASKKLDIGIDGEEAMAMLRITSLTTLQKLRDTSAIEYSQPMVKIILYKRESILAYIEKYAKKTFLNERSSCRRRI